MGKKKVLVFPCGSEIGLEIYKSLCYSTHFELYGGSSVDDHGKFVYQNYIGGIPQVKEDSFLKEFNKLIAQWGIDVIIPAHDDVALELSRAKSAGELGCDVLSSPAETNKVARSKKETYQFLAGVVPTPKVFRSVSELGQESLPVFLKPDKGQGSKGTYKANTLEEASFYVKTDPSLLLLEYLPGKEFTVDCFTDRNGTLRFAEGRERRRITNGISVGSVSAQNEQFWQLAEAINNKLKFRGVWFFQLKENKQGDLVLMEIAPRVAGTMGLVRCRGVNLVLLSLFDWLGYDIDIFENKYDISIDRALSNRYEHSIKYGHVYIDFDDLIIFNGKVNPQVMAFVYQCLNKGVKIHLITKHKEDLEKSLEKYRLGHVFDEVIWIKDDAEKPVFIKEKDSIFIDDSFAERKRVYDEVGIPVFDSHMIESLIEKG